MSNRASIQPTKFENVRSGHVTLGVRVHDDYGQSYDNTWDSIPDDDLDVLQKVLDSEDEVIKSILTPDKGIYIGDIWYDWEQIKHLWEETDE
jgi:hypothetical protein